MKLAILGVLAAGFGIGTSTPGAIGVGFLWIVGGLVIRAVFRPISDEVPDPKGSWGDEYGGRRGVVVALIGVVGALSIVVGVGSFGFEPDDGWRWVPVGVGAFLILPQLLALLAFALGSSMLAVAGIVGDPTHPARIRLDSVRSTGVYVNEQPKLELDLTVRPEGRPEFRITVKQVVTHAELGAVRVGSWFRGLVDLEVRDGIRLDWHDPLPDENAGPDTEGIADRLRALDGLLERGEITQAEHRETRARVLGTA